jgi:hypothetical protein
MRRHRLRVLQRAAVREVRRDPGRPERVVADRRHDAGRERALAHHAPAVGLGHRLVGQNGASGMICTHFQASARIEAWFAIAAAFSSVPPFFRYAEMPEYPLHNNIDCVVPFEIGEGMLDPNVNLNQATEFIKRANQNGQGWKSCNRAIAGDKIFVHPRYMHRIRDRPCFCEKPNFVVYGICKK